MCVLFFAHQVHQKYPLIFAGNRDESYSRPAAVVDWWSDSINVLAGRDLQAGGTWLGVTKGGRWSVVTNVRDLEAHGPRDHSRGELPTEFLTGSLSPAEYAGKVFKQRQQFNPFNLIVGDSESVWIVSSHVDVPTEVPSGVYGLSNATLDVPWPKVVRGKKVFQRMISSAEPDVESFLDFLHDDMQAPDVDLPNTGVGLEMERRLSPLFIASDAYGTRASSVIMLNDDGGRFVERTFRRGGLEGATIDVKF